MRKLMLMAAACLPLATPADAQLRYTAKTAAECPATAERAMKAVLYYKGLDLRQRFNRMYGRDYERIVTFKSGLRGLEAERDRDQVRLAEQCAVHFRGFREADPFVYEWSDGR